MAMGMRDHTITRRSFAAAVAAVAVSPWPAIAAEVDPYDAHVADLRTRLPGEGFTIVVAKPFVVVGDNDAAVVRAHAERTVAWAIRMLKHAYFDRDPLHILDVWLFRDKASYEANVLKLWGTKPTSPYGYYTATNRALVMNIATGGGTLVHEIVHPFIESNFPRCPSWFNEGLASLYEQSAERDGGIVGLTNWRLAGLQKAIADGKLGTFERLTSTTTLQFYNNDRGNNYAQARYLCYWLQQKGKLREYYKAFAAAVADDPTGYKTLRQVGAIDDVAAFEKSWRQWAMTLRFPPSS